MYLTPHFTLQELTLSQVAARDGLLNTPAPDVQANLKLLCLVLEQVRELVAAPIIISSGFRCAELNRRVGGAVDSAHVRGLAADFSSPACSPRELAERIRDSELVFDQLILEFDQWVHLAVTPDTPRREVLTVRRGTGYLPGIR
ncbi:MULTISPECIES: D-Ala-D-Ala carboxypeptidase family metallohydrolase [unclassified Pseudomonas]|uniref:D-Ala-D-Ala carboxypeptidase family metallohydrolase n=1 Tax=unclassified Pseudomonas TaxID=196821 RepID=UPI0035C02D98